MFVMCRVLAAPLLLLWSPTAAGIFAPRRSQTNASKGSLLNVGTIGVAAAPSADDAAGLARASASTEVLAYVRQWLAGELAHMQDNEEDEESSESLSIGATSARQMREANPRLYQCRQCLCIMRSSNASRCDLEEADIVNHVPVLANGKFLAAAASGGLQASSGSQNVDINAFSERQHQCLRDAPCCDCDACQQGWSPKEYPHEPDIGLQCQSACLRCRSHVPYTLADVKVLHPSADVSAEPMERWQAFAKGSSTLAWATSTCAAAPTNSSAVDAVPRLDELVLGRASCLVAAVGRGLTRHCACANRHGCGTAAPDNPLVHTNFVSGSSSADLRRVWESVSVAEKQAEAAALVKADVTQRSASLCASEKSFHAALRPGNTLAASLSSASEFKTDEHLSLGVAVDAALSAFEEAGVVRTIVQAWAELQADHIMSIKPDVANSGMNHMHDWEVVALSSQLLADHFTSEDHGCRESGEHGFWGPLCATLRAEATDVMEDLATELSSLSACSTALSACEADALGCGEFAASLTKANLSSESARQLFMQEVSTSCANRTALLGLMNIAAECPGPLPAKMMRAARDVVTEFREDDSFCRRTRLLVASVVESPVDADDESTPDVPQECLNARSRCSASDSCMPAVDAMKKQHPSVKGMLAQALSLCPKKQELLLALDVTAECPGLLPQKEMRESRDALAQEDQAVLCAKMKELVEVLELLLIPEPSAACLRASQECRNDKPCALLGRAADKSQHAMSLSVDEALTVCSSKSSLFSALRVAAECSELPTGDARIAHEAQSVLEDVPEKQLCERAQQLRQDLERPAPSKKSAMLSKSVSEIRQVPTTPQELVKGALARLATVYAHNLVHVFDVAPKDDHLNVVEVETMLRALKPGSVPQAKEHDMTVPRAAADLASMSVANFEHLFGGGLRIGQVDSDGDNLMDARELDKAWQPVLQREANTVLALARSMKAV